MGSTVNTFLSSIMAIGLGKQGWWDDGVRECSKNGNYSWTSGVETKEPPPSRVGSAANAAPKEWRPMLLVV